MTGTAIADHGIIGHLPTAALISADGSVCSFASVDAPARATRSVG
jgi:hypothetical protein